MREVKSPAPVVAPRREAGRPGNVLGTLASRPIRTVLRWQVIAAVGIAALSAAGGGWTAAGSALLGGGVAVAAVVAYALMLGAGREATAGAVVATMLRAEAVKIVVIMLGLWAVLTQVPWLSKLPMFAAFVVAVMLQSVALLAKGGPRGQERQD